MPFSFEILNRNNELSLTLFIIATSCEFRKMSNKKRLQKSCCFGKIHRREFIRHGAYISLGSLIGSGLSCQEHLQQDHPKNDRPNLLFICADEMREMAMSCSGNPNLHTPNLDRLAAEGVRFTRMYTTSPLCSPARSTLMTGLYPHNAGVTNNNMHLREDVRCISEITTAAGYRTGHIGKWHLQGNYRPGSSAEYAYVPPEHHRGFQYWAGFEHGHRYFDCRYYTNNPTPIIPPKGSYEPDVQTDLALAFIENHADEPWHLDLSWGPPHFPLDQVKPQDLARHNPDTILLRPNVPVNFQEQARKDLCFYYAMIENLDWNLGRLLQKLDTLGMTENTIVVFTADHGDMMLSHGQHYKRRPQEESARVPYLIRYPRRIPPGRTYELLSSLVDSFVTILELMQLKASAHEGISFAPWLTGHTQPHTRKAVFMECPQFGCRSYDPGLYARTPWRAIRTQTHKAAFLKVQPTQIKLVQLYDLVQDPYEQNNLAEITGHESIRRNLTDKLWEWINDSQAR